MSTILDSVGAKSVGTSPVDVFTVPGAPASATIQQLLIANKLPATDITVDVTWTDSSAADTYFLHPVELTAHGTDRHLQQPD